MGRKAEHYLTVGEGANAQSVGYSTTVRDGYFGVRFADAEGNRVEKMTKCAAPTNKKGKPKPDQNFHIEAARIIARAYAPTYPSPSRVSWEEALADVLKNTPTARPATVEAFQVAVKGFLSTMDGDEKTSKKPTAPLDVTEDVARRFARVFLATPYRRGKTGIDRFRSPVTLSYYVRSLSALFNHFVELGHAKTHPWKDVKVPAAEKKQKHVPTEEEIINLMSWVQAKYPNWERLHALLQLKMLSACRSLDVCQLRSCQLERGHLVFFAHQVKNKADRKVPLPPELFATLERVAGKNYLWEEWNDDVRKFRPGRNPLPETFKVKTVKTVLNNIFREYSDSHPELPRITPHSLRRRAITIMVTVTKSVDLTAQSLGLTAQTARSYYLDAQRALDTSEAFAATTALLLPPMTPVPPANPPASS